MGAYIDRLFEPDELEGKTPEELWYRGDSWYKNTPKELWTQGARRLFNHAEAEGIIQWLDIADCYVKGKGVSKTNLAYFCKRASKHLRLSKGSHTNWKPFERVFGNNGASFKSCLCIADARDKKGLGLYKKRIDEFFDGHEELLKGEEEKWQKGLISPSGRQ